MFADIMDERMGDRMKIQNMIEATNCLRKPMDYLAKYRYGMLGRSSCLTWARKWSTMATPIFFASKHALRYNKCLSATKGGDAGIDGTYIGGQGTCGQMDLIAAAKCTKSTKMVKALVIKTN